MRNYYYEQLQEQSEETVTIAQLDTELRRVIERHHVYGAEAIINALIRACEGRDYLSREYVIKLVNAAYKRMGETQ